jgi:hypothetical protein
MSKPFAWSWSALDSFETCPRRHNEIKVAKTVKEEEGPELVWGNAVHKALELRVRDGAPLPKTMSQWEPLVEKILARPGTTFAERQIALDRNFEVVPWFSKSAWVRAVLDVSKVGPEAVLVLDYKTGKRKPNSDQLMLSAAILFHVHPKVERVISGFLWLKTKEVDKATYTRDQLPSMWNALLPRVQRFEQAYDADVWPEKPSGLCRKWCPVRACSHNGG